MRSRFLISVLCLCALLLSACGKKTPAEQEYIEEEIVPIRYEYGLAIDSFRVDTGYVGNGETLGGILNRLGATGQQVGQVGMLPREEFDVRQIRAGKQYLALYDTANVLQYWVYLPDARTAKVLHLTDSLHVEHIQKPIRIVPRKPKMW